MNATLSTLFLIGKPNKGFFLYYSSCKEKINVGIFLKKL
jgi:hypothetical protein